MNYKVDGKCPDQTLQCRIDAAKIRFIKSWLKYFALQLSFQTTVDLIQFSGDSSR